MLERCVALKIVVANRLVTLPKAPISSNNLSKLIPMLFLKDLVGRILYDQAIFSFAIIVKPATTSPLIYGMLVHHFNPLSHNIKIQILRTDLHAFS